MASIPKAKPAKSAPPKVFDVSHPGKAPASSTSRPVIVSNHPVLKDPMMVEDSIPDKPVIGPVKPAKRLVITPLHDLGNLGSSQSDEAPENTTGQAVDEPAANRVEGLPELEEEKVDEAAQPVETVRADEVETDEAPAEDTGIAEPAAAEPVEATEPTEPSTQEAQTESAKQDPVKLVEDSVPEGDALGQELTPPNNEEDAAAREAAARQAELQKIIDSREYFLPINATGKRRTKLHIIAGVSLIVILGLVWLDIALDAGLVELGGLQALTHFFE